MKLALSRCSLGVILIFSSGMVSAQNVPDETGTPAIQSGIYHGLPVTYQVVNGRAIYQGDVVLEKVLPAMDPNQVHRNGFGTAYPSYLWPKVGTEYQIPYIITTSGDNLSAALTAFNNTFAGFIQFVARGTQADYVNFDFGSGTNGQCEVSGVGHVGGEQTVGGASNCSFGTLLHEMGHVVGLWHEQSRPDRNTYVSFNYQNVIKGSASNFAILSDNAQTVGFYDYASVMHYIPFAFSRNGGPVLESIPAGILLSNEVGYTAADVDTIDRLYGVIPTNVTVTSNPPGLQVIVDGATITTPQTFPWTLNSAHTLDMPSGAQALSGTTYIYGRWNDSASASHTVTVSPGNGQVTQPQTAPAVTVYSANFIELVGFNPLVSPTGSGSFTENPAPITVSGASGQFYTVRQPVTFTATPSAGYSFYEWFSYMPGAVSSNPKTVYMESQPPSTDVTAGFSPNAITTITSSPADPSAAGVLVDEGFWYAPKNFSLLYDPTWTTGSSHAINVDSPQQPYSVNTQYVFQNWSDGGAQSHNISVPATNAAFTATLQPQYVPVYYANQSCAGSILATPSPLNGGFYAAGTNVTFTETTQPGWTFTGWQGDLSGTQNPQALAINDEELVIADFNTAAAPLTVTSLSPPNTVAGNLGFTLTINGTGFSSQSQVWINGNFRGGSTFVSSTKLTAPIFASDIATAGAFQVGVQNFPAGATCAAWSPTTFFVLLSGKTTTTVALASSLNPASYGQSVTFTATVQHSGSGTPTGTVTFMDGSNSIGSGTLNSGAQATLTTNTLAIGTHSITAVYGGDASFQGATSAPLTETVKKASTTTTLTSTPNPSTFGQSVALTATVKSAGSIVPTGTVTFKQGATTLGSGSLNSGAQATLNTSKLAVGTDSLTAMYAGNSNFAGSTSPVRNQVVNKASTTTALTSTPNPSKFDQNVTFTATVTPSAATGSVTFKDGTTTLGTGALAGGKARFSTTGLSKGTHSITAVYGGGANYSGSTSPILTQTVN